MENKSIYDQLGEISEKQDEILEAVNKTNAKTAQADQVKRTVNQRNQYWSLKNFINRSVHEYMWLGTRGDFEKERTVSIALIVASLISMFLCTIIATISFGIYSTFTLFENIWFVLGCFALKYAISTKKNYSTLDFSCNSFEIFTPDSDGVLRSTGYKKKYKFFFKLSCAGFVLNIISAWLIPCSAPFWVMLFELICLALNIVTMLKVVDFFAGYGPIKFTGMNESGTSRVSIVFDPAFNQLYTEEDYLKTFPFMK